MEEKFWEQFTTSGSIYDYLQYRGVACQEEIHSDCKIQHDLSCREQEKSSCNDFTNNKELREYGRNNSNGYGIGSDADRRL